MFYLWHGTIAFSLFATAGESPVTLESALQRDGGKEGTYIMENLLIFWSRERQKSVVERRNDFGEPLLEDDK